MIHGTMSHECDYCGVVKDCNTGSTEGRVFFVCKKCYHENSSARRTANTPDKTVKIVPELKIAGYLHLGTETAGIGSESYNKLKVKAEAKLKHNQAQNNHFLNTNNLEIGTKRDIKKSQFNFNLIQKKPKKDKHNKSHT